MMMKIHRTLFFITAMSINFCLDAQRITNKEEAKEVVRNFYHLLVDKKFVSLNDYKGISGENALENEESFFYKKCLTVKDSNDCSKEFRERLSRPSSFGSEVFFEIKRHQNFLTGGLTDINEIMAKFKIIDDNSTNSTYCEVEFSPDNKIHFIVGNFFDNFPKYIWGIYLPDGTNPIDKSQPFMCYGVINDHDGYSNIRAGKGLKSPVKWKYNRNDIFMVFPNYKEQWWEVQDLLSCEKGFISRSRVIVFSQLLKSKRDSLRDTLNVLSVSHTCK